MNTKKTMLALSAMAVFAFVALPAVASGYEMDLPENPEFTVSGEAMALTTAEAHITCTSGSGGGIYHSPTSGTVEYTFHGCKLSGTNCQSAGQPSGTITTTTTSFDVVSIPPFPPAHVLQPNKGHVMTVTCVFGLVKIEVGGTGVIGTISSPGVGESSNTMELSFATEGGAQVHTEIEGDETVYELEASINGGESEPMGLDWQATNSFVEGGEGVLTE